MSAPNASSPEPNMTPSWLKSLPLAGCVWLLVSARADAQPLFGGATSIECVVLNSDVVVVGKVVEVGDGKPAEQGGAPATVAVEETLKGGHRERLRVRTPFPVATLAKWKGHSSRLLLAAKGDPLAATSVLALADEGLDVLTADFALLRKPEDVIRGAKETVRRMPGVREVDTFRLVVPAEAVAGTEWAKYYGSGGHITLLVPVDERLEKRAREYTGGESYDRREEGARALRYFRSDENVTRVRGLLGDPGWAYAAHAGENRGVEVRIYGVRKAAYEALQYWGVSAEAPVIREEVWKPGSVRTVDLSNAKVTAAALKDLAVFKNLQSLYLRNTDVDDAGLKVLAGHKGLQNLALGNTAVTDAGLKHLAGLTGLRSLELGVTGVTDAGLKELAGLQSLEHLYLNGTAVTEAGVKELACLKNLAVLDLRKTPVTDAGLKGLAGFPSLQELYLEGAEVTDGGVAALRKVRPKLTVHH
jgi:hypothetical protein